MVRIDKWKIKEMEYFDLEYTDLFNGEANYAWVRRQTIAVPVGTSDLTIMRTAKKAFGLNKHRGITNKIDDSFIHYPRDLNTVLFVNYHPK